MTNIQDFFAEHGGNATGSEPCDGAFQAALASMPFGGELYIPVGTYLLQKQMQGPGDDGQLQPALTIRGESVTAVLLFDFAEQSGMGDGILACHSTPAQALCRVRIADLSLINLSHTNCIVPTSSTVSSSGSSPAISVDWHPFNVWSIRIKIAAGGASGTATYDASFDGGANYTVRGRFTSTTPFLVPGIGIRVAFPTGTYVAGHTYDIGSTGYAGAAVRTTGGGDILIDGCLIYGWSRAFVNDGGLKNAIRDCHFGNTGNPGNPGGGVPLAAQGAAWCTGATYQFGYDDSTNGFEMLNCRVHTLAFGVWHEGGMNHRVEGCEFSQGTQYPMLLRNARNVSWSSNYFEGSGGPAGDNPGRGAFISSCQGSAPTNVTFEKSIVGNLNKVPLVECLFPSSIGVLAVRDNLVIQSPNGTGSPPVGTTLCVGVSLIGNLDWRGNYVALSTGTEFDQEPQAGTYFSQGLHNGCLGLNTMKPGAGIHLSHTNTTLPMLLLERFTTNRGLFRLENDAKLLTHGHSPYGQGPHGVGEFVEHLTTHTGQLEAASVYPMPEGRVVAGRVDILVRSAAGNLSSYWQFRIHAKRVDSAPAAMVDVVMKDESLEGDYGEPEFTMQTDGIVCTVKQGEDTHTGRWEVVWRMTQRSDGG